MHSPYSRILQKTFLWTDSLKHMFQDFKLNSEPEMSGRAGKAGLGPSWLYGCNLLLYPKWTFGKSSQQGRAPHGLFILVGSSKKHIKDWRGRTLCTGLLKTPGSIQDPLSSVSEESKMLIFHPPASPPTRLLKLTKTQRAAGRLKGSCALNLTKRKEMAT